MSDSGRDRRRRGIPLGAAIDEASGTVYVRPERCVTRIEPVPGVSGPFDLAVDEGTQTLYATSQDDRPWC